MREEELAGIEKPEPGHKARAQDRWAAAVQFTQQASSIEAWGGGIGRGTYMYIPTSEMGNQWSPSFQSQGDKNKWLYLATTGAWWLGMQSRRQSGATGVPNAARSADKGQMRSDGAVKPGTLPHEVETWEELDEKGQWIKKPAFRFWLSQQVAVEWLKMTVAAYEAPVISIRGTGVKGCDGLYDVVSKSLPTPGQPPKFRHQQFPDKWLFLASDQRWCIGDTAGAEAATNRKQLSSGYVQPGWSPSDNCTCGWKRASASGKQEPCEGIDIQSLTSGARASDKWALANERTVNVEVWGKEAEFGEFELQPTLPSEPPMYRYKSDHDVWLYLATDGCWWMSSSENTHQRKPKGWLSSDLVQPGTLPQDVKRWREASDSGSWQANPLISVMDEKAVASAWQQARTEVLDTQVIELEGVSDMDLDGFFDFVPGEGSLHDPPVYQHQVNQDVWLYVATDGRWWVGAYENMQRRLPRGKLHGRAMLPGTLPTQVTNWLVYHGETKEFQLRSEVTVS
jgi:hypothetical protein